MSGWCFVYCISGCGSLQIGCPHFLNGALHLDFGVAAVVDIEIGRNPEVTNRDSTPN